MKPRKRLLKKIVEEIFDHVQTEVGLAHLNIDERRRYDNASPHRYWDRMSIIREGASRAGIGDLWKETKGQTEKVLAWVDKWASRDLRVRIHEGLAKKGLMEPTPDVLAKWEAEKAAHQAILDQMAEKARQSRHYYDFRDWCKRSKCPRLEDPIKFWEEHSGLRYKNLLVPGGVNYDADYVLRSSLEELIKQGAEPDLVMVAEIQRDFCGEWYDYEDALTAFDEELTKQFRVLPETEWRRYVKDHDEPVSELRRWLKIFKTCGFEQLGGIFCHRDVGASAWLVWNSIGIRLRVPACVKQLEISVGPSSCAVDENSMRHTPYLF